MASRIDKARAMAAALGVDEPNPQMVEALASSIKSGPNTFLIETDGGFMVGNLVRSLGSDQLEAHEIALYSSDGSAPKMIASFERWAKERGAVKVVICFPRERKMRGYYVQGVQMAKVL